MSRRKTARSIRNAELRVQARGGIERKRAEQRAIQARGGHRTPVPSDAETKDAAMPESGVDALEAMVDAEADDLDRAINNPDAETEDREPDFIDRVVDAGISSVGGPEAGE